MAHVSTFRHWEGTLLKGLLLGSALLLPRPGQAFEVPPDRESPASAAGQDSGSTLLSVEPKPLVPVDIEDHEKITYVSVGPKTCAVPCRLWVPRGIHPVFADGQARGGGHLVVDGPTRARFVRQQTEYRTAGAILLPIGLLTPGLIGLVKTCRTVNGLDLGCLIAHSSIWPLISLGTLIPGLILLISASGTPLKLIQVVTSDSSRPTQPQKLQLTGIGISPTPSGGNLMTAFEF